MKKIFIQTFIFKFTPLIIAIKIFRSSAIEVFKHTIYCLIVVESIMFKIFQVMFLKFFLNNSTVFFSAKCIFFAGAYIVIKHSCIVVHVSVFKIFQIICLMNTLLNSGLLFFSVRRLTILKHS